METQTRLRRHNKFISAENIIGIFSVSSDDSFTCSVLSRISMVAARIMQSPSNELSTLGSGIKCKQPNAADVT